MQPQRAPHHVRHDDVPLDLVDPEEQERDPERGDRMDDDRVDKRRKRTEPGAEVWDQLGDGHPRAEEDGVRVRARDPAQGPE